MAKTRAQKENTLNKIKESLEQSPSVIFTDYKGLNAEKSNELRAKLKEVGARMEITKNALIQKANPEIKLQGPTATIFSGEDALSPIKSLVAFLKESKVPTIKMGILDGEILDEGKMLELSKLPSRDELIAKMLGSLNAPISNFVGVNREVYSSFVRTVSAYKDTKTE